MSWYREVYLWSPHWRRLRRDKLDLTPNCQDCDAPALDVHHVTYRNLWDVTVADLRSLCRPCHDKRHQNLSVAVKADLKRALDSARSAMDRIKSNRRQFHKDLAKRRKLARRCNSPA